VRTRDATSSARERREVRRTARSSCQRAGVTKARPTFQLFHNTRRRRLSDWIQPRGLETERESFEFFEFEFFEFDSFEFDSFEFDAKTRAKPVD
jgi:hypothetical protein